MITVGWSLVDVLQYEWHNNISVPRTRIPATRTILLNLSLSPKHPSCLDLIHLAMPSFDGKEKIEQVRTSRSTTSSEQAVQQRDQAYTKLK